MIWPPVPTCHAQEPQYPGHEPCWQTREDEHFRRCSYCGSMHPEDLLAAVNQGATLGGSGWKYGPVQGMIGYGIMQACLTKTAILLINEIVNGTLSVSEAQAKVVNGGPLLRYVPFVGSLETYQKIVSMSQNFQKTPKAGLSASAVPAPSDTIISAGTPKHTPKTLVAADISSKGYGESSILGESVSSADYSMTEQTATSLTSTTEIPHKKSSPSLVATQENACAQNWTNAICSALYAIAPDIQILTESPGQSYYGPYPHKFYVTVPNPNADRIVRTGSASLYDKETRQRTNTTTYGAQGPTIHAKWYSRHLLDEGYSSAALALLIGVIHAETNILFRFDDEGRLAYQAPHFGYQRP